MTKKTSFLSEKVDYKTIKCLTTKVSIVDFCRTKKQDIEEIVSRGVSRGIILEKKSLVICEYVDSINLSVSCQSKLVKDDCLFPERSCLILKDYYATDLKLFHHSNPTGEVINCHFVKNKFFNVEAF